MKYGFKLIKLRLKDNPIFNDCSFDFFDKDDKGTSSYTTVVIGPNGTGKSNLFRIIIFLFAELEILKQRGKRLQKVTGKFSIEYEYKSKKFAYRNHDFENETDLPENTKSKIELFCDNVKIDHKDLQLPNRVIALSNTITDKFPVEIEGFLQYAYLGVKTNSNTARTTTYITKTIDLLYTTLIDEEIDWRISHALNFLGYDKQMLISYYPRYKHVFFKGNLTESTFGKFFTRFWEYTKRDKDSPPWSLNVYKRIKRESPEVITELVELCNLISGNLQQEYEGSRTQYFEFNIFKSFISKRQQQLLKVLHSLDIISYPGISFVKDNKYFGMEQTSSGEYHFISGFIGMLASIKTESLILIDEPENSLHPNWQMKYIGFLREIFRHSTDSHFLIATHSHFMISDLEPKSSTIIALSKDEKIRALAMPINTYGWSAEEILVKIFKVSSTRNYYITEKLESIFKIISSEPTSKSITELKQKTQELREIDFSGISSEDPLKLVIENILNRV